jgi:hypothetical protein
MKRLGLLIVCFATLALTSCGAIQSAASSNTVAQASGQACGTAVQNLYSSYKSTGTVDLTNANNLNNALALATAYTNLKQNKDNEAYRKSFTTGLILSSAGLITQANATQFIDKLLATAGLGNINTQNVAQTAATAAAIITLLNTLKQ